MIKFSLKQLKEHIQQLLSERKPLSVDFMHVVRLADKFLQTALQSDNKFSTISWTDAGAFLVVKSQNLKDQNLIQQLTNYLKKNGWVLSRVENDAIYYEPSYSDRVEQVPSTLYHITSSKNVKNILKKGLTPKEGVYNSKLSTLNIEKNKRAYPARIYLSTNIKLADILRKSFVKLGDDNNFITLQVDTNNLLPGTKFYKDIEQPGSIWTYSRIPASAVSIYGVEDDKTSVDNNSRSSGEGV